MDKPFFERMPKAEHHLHYEGAWPWETIRKHHPDRANLPARPPWLECDKPFADFDAFRVPFLDYVQPCMTSPEALCEIAREFVQWLARCGIRYVEAGASAQFMERAGIRFEDGMPGVLEALQSEAQRLGVTVRVIAAFNRNFPVDIAADHLERWLALGEGAFHGIDLQGYEPSGAAAPFLPLYDIARDHGLRLKAHAGEHGGPEAVREAIDVLGATHIGHGVRAVEDPALLRELASRGTVLNVCPTSNVMLDVCRTMSEHPIRRLLDAGVRVTLSTDDPLVFGIDLNDEYLALHESLGFTADELRRLARAGFEEALLSNEEKQRFLTEINAAFGA